MLIVLIVSIFPLGINVRPVAATGTIYIRASGAVDPPSPISNVGNSYYTFTADINAFLVIERDNIVVDGAGHTLQGPGTGSGTGISLSGRSNVTIANVTVNDFWEGISLVSSSNITVYRNNIGNASYCNVYVYNSSHSTITQNNATGSSASSSNGINLYNSTGNVVSYNGIVNNCNYSYGIYLSSCSSNMIDQNSIASTNSLYPYGIYLSSSWNNTVQRNNATSSYSSSSFSTYVLGSWNNTFSENYARHNYNYYGYGFYIYNSSSNVLSKNNATSAYPVYFYGIYVYNATNNIMSGNAEANSLNFVNVNYIYGIYAAYASNSTITRNSAVNSNYNYSYGIYLYNSSNNAVTENNETGSSIGYSYGLNLYYSSNNNISDNNIARQSSYGINIYNSTGNDVIRNNVTGSANGIMIGASANSTVAENRVKDSYSVSSCGLYLSSCTNVTVVQNTAVNNSYGIRVSSSSNNSLTQNSIADNLRYGLTLETSGGNVLRNNLITGTHNNTYIVGSNLTNYLNDVDTSNTINGKPFYYLVNLTDVTIPSDAAAVVLVNCARMKVQDLSLSDNGQSVLLAFTNDSTVQRNRIANSQFGIDVRYSSNNTVVDNDVQNGSSNGFFLMNSTSSTIVRNNATNNLNGIVLSSSGNNMLRNNLMEGNTRNFIVSGASLADFLNDADTSNTVNSKPIYYWINRTDQVIPSDAGCAILVNSSHMTAENLNLANNGPSVLLAFTQNSVVQHNFFQNCTSGVDVRYSSNNTIYDNIISTGSVNGIMVNNSTGNTIIGNTATNCTNGITIQNSTANIIKQNNFGSSTNGINCVYSFLNIFTLNSLIGNSYGIRLFFSLSNKFYFNSISSIVQVSSQNSTNTWDVGYPAGGNYWSDYSGTDSNGDGIGDTPYVIDANNVDHYPLMKPWNPTLAVEGVTAWYWTGSTVVNSVAVGDVDGDGQKETVTGGTYFDGSRNEAQLVVWDSSSLTVKRLTTWYWTGNTNIMSVAAGDVDGDAQVEIVTGGYYNDSMRNVAQLVVWAGSDLSVKRLTTWYWTGNTEILSVAIGDVDADAQTEIVTGGIYNDSARNVAQLVVWNGANLAVDRLTTWCWTGNTAINSVALGDVDADGQTEIVTGGRYNDGTRDVAQLVVWNGANLAVDRLTTWYWTGNTMITSVALGDVDADGKVEVVTGGYYFDGTRQVAQLVEWNGASLAVERLTTWYWTSHTTINSVALGDTDSDGQAEIVTGGYYNDGSRNVAQLVVWSGSSLAVKNVQAWFWTGNTFIDSVGLSDINGDLAAEITTGGAYYESAHWNAQLAIWGMKQTP